jgi:hypothetical protein
VIWSLLKFAAELPLRSCREACPAVSATPATSSLAPVLVAPAPTLPLTKRVPWTDAEPPACRSPWTVSAPLPPHSLPTTTPFLFNRYSSSSPEMCSRPAPEMVLVMVKYRLPSTLSEPLRPTGPPAAVRRVGGSAAGPGRRRPA